ncbi:hypothetical protein K438DRAFT_1088447 [Mycena galopus ATCC 62051]|nr:hypothetical protein K438DRAFT_1088447 [Mycena galopus ATCC 62051]
MVPPWVALTLCALLAFGKAHAALTNITIDDTNSTYWTFVGSYHAVTPTTPCIGCTDNPDAGLVYNSTWHDGALRSGSFVFQGAAVYIYGIDVVNPANVTFAMNNPTINGFHYFSANGYVYNSLFFSATGLDATVQHTVTWLMEQSSAGGGSALFDYAIVTVDTADSSSSASGSSSTGGASSTGGTSTPSTTPSPSPSGAAKKKSDAGTIAGAVVGGIVLLALLGTLVFFLRRRQSTGATTRDMGGAHGNINRSQNFHASDAASRGTSAPTEYMVEPYQPSGFPHPQPFVHGGMPNSPSMSEASMRSAPIANVPQSAPGTTGYDLPFQPPVPPHPVLRSETSGSESASLSAASLQPVRPPMSSKRVPVPVLAWDPNDPTGQRAARDQEVQDRLRHLEDLVAASQPPVYS